MIESKTIELETADGRETATVSQLPAMRGVKLFARLGKLVGPGIAGLDSALGKGGDVEALAPAIGALFASLDPEAVEGFLLELFATTKIGAADLNRPTFDLKFRGNLKSVWKLAVFALEVQFGNFFGDLVAAGRAALVAKAGPSATSTTSTGPSTA